MRAEGGSQKDYISPDPKQIENAPCFINPPPFLKELLDSGGHVF
jgi:hypothetical protein